MQVFDFVRHWITSNTRHGVHSPFVYKLVEDCIYQSKPELDQDVAAHFEQLKHSEELLTGLDFGKTEKGQKSKRTVSDFAKTSSIKRFQLELLIRLADYHRSNQILELGTNLGKTTAALAKTSPESNICSIEGNEAVARFARENIQRLQIQNAEIHCSTFDSFLHSNKRTFDFIFLDGDHRYEPTLRYFDLIKSKLIGNGPIILHDIYWSSGMKRAWNKIIHNHEHIVSIDLFWMGLIYFRPNQASEHFKVRFPKRLLEVFL